MLLAVTCAAAARAEGDPAAEHLQTRNMFTPYPRGVNTLPQRRLLKDSIQRVYDNHQRVRVAVIAHVEDLETFPQFFRKPRPYARFVGREIKPFYRGPLLIVMPNGFGFWDGGRPTDAAERVLSQMRIRSPKVTALIAVAAQAVDRLSRAGALAAPDTVAPRVYPEVPFGRPGTTLTIKYHVLEDSQESTEVVTVVSGSDELARMESPFKPAVYKYVHRVTWPMPKPAPRNLEYCVVATDRSGNTSAKVCTPIKLLPGA